MGGWFWLEEISERVDGDVPPVTEAEVAELAAWFTQNDAHLWALSQPSQMPQVGSRRRSCADLRYGRVLCPGRWVPAHWPRICAN